MSYSDIDDLRKEINEDDLARLTGDIDGLTVNETRVTAASEKAFDVINTYLRGRFTVPLIEPIDPIIKSISIDLTFAYLYEEAYATGSVPSTIVWRKIMTLKMLKDLRSGLYTLNPAYNQQGESQPQILSNKSISERSFSSDQMADFP
ncbi:MAG: DUF1320 family protein [Candidatus Kapabacteria bacterium]|jgi:phage gp36-like protein|nr:DUF1320 family protein [Candidatus Kapabacteria bacterium]